MLLKKKRGSAALEILMVFPYFLAILILFAYMQLALMEVMLLDQAGSETAKWLAMVEIGEQRLEQWAAGAAGVDLAGIFLKNIELSGEPAAAVICRMDASGMLRRERFVSARLKRDAGILRVEAGYESSFIPGLVLTTRAAERSWAW